MNLAKRLAMYRRILPGRLPAIERIEGRYTVIERPSKEKHGADLYQVYGPDPPAAMWTFLFKRPAHNEEEWDHLLMIS